MSNIDHLRDFVLGMTALVGRTQDEDECIEETRRLVSILISRDDWLPEPFAKPNPDTYQQYLLHCDPLERFSAVSFVWGPGQKTPIHDHTVWGVVGILRGGERTRNFTRDEKTGALTLVEDQYCPPGAIAIVSPTRGDIHEVSNALPDAPSISIHVYGANIGAVHRHAFDPATGAVKDFVSGYSSTETPNLWDRSAAVRARIAKA